MIGKIAPNEEACFSKIGEAKKEFEPFIVMNKALGTLHIVIGTYVDYMRSKLYYKIKDSVIKDYMDANAYLILDSEDDNFFIRLKEIQKELKQLTCKHTHMPYSGSMPCTGIRRCTNCGIRKDELKKLEKE